MLADTDPISNRLSLNLDGRFFSFYTVVRRCWQFHKSNVIDIITVTYMCETFLSAMESNTTLNNKTATTVSGSRGGIGLSTAFSAVPVQTNDDQVRETPRDDQLCQLNTPGYQGHQSAHQQWQNAMHQGGQGWQNQVMTPRPGTNHAHGNGYLQQKMLQPVYNTPYLGTWSGTPFVSHPNTTHGQQPQLFGLGQEFGAPPLSVIAVLLKDTSHHISGPVIAVLLRYTSHHLLGKVELLFFW